MPTPLIPLALLTLTSHALNLSYTNIRLLQTYEQKTEKAAKYSNTAAWRLRKTRTTQGSGTVAVSLPVPVPVSSSSSHFLSSGF
ncbi:hypothetical protein CC80DRAFT_497817 [Byssothecium circinans]|uniref:Secreted protein n=1 Tax=Byssothecium circinans TaxID=147558 RepID=A0A6A5TDZ2_9PLEO|nr:hypothetical protein CC80DRAFT_497817 [Byssothecium circinans]